MRRCSSSYVISKMKIKAAMRFCYIQIRTVKTQNTDDTQHQQGERWVGQQEPPSLWHNATSSKPAEDLALFIFSFKSCLFVCLSAYWGPVHSCLQCVYVGQRTTLSFHYRGSTDCTEVISLALLCRLSHFLDFNNLLNIKYTLPPDRVV